MKNILQNFIKNKTFISIFISFIIYSSLCFQKILVPYNILSIIVFGIIYFFVRNVDFNYKYKKELAIISSIFSLLLIIGRILYSFRYSPTLDPFSEFLRFKTIIYFLGNMLLIYCLLMRMIPELMKLKINKKEKEIPKIFLLSFIVIIICYLPYLLTFFPGILTLDSLSEMGMILKIASITDHHTVAHLLFMIIPFKIGTLICNNINISVGLISITQIIVMALTFSYIILFLKKKKLPNILIIIILLYYALLPVNGFYSVTLWKDIIFSCSMLLFSLECYKMIEKRNNITIRNSLIFIITSILVVFTRNNAIYMYILFSIVSIYVFRNKLKTIIVILLIVFTSYAIVKGPVYSMLHISKSKSAEYLAIPLQQVGRMAYKNVKFTKKEKKMINDIIPIEEMKKVYNPEIVDPIKFNKKYKSKNFEKNKFEYLKMWANLCYKHPKIATESFLISTLGYWYPGTKYWVTTANIESNRFGIHSYTFVPEIIRKNAIKIMSNKIPILGFFNCVAFYFWLIFLCIFLTIKKKGKRYLYVYVPVLGIWLTMFIATPVFSEFRYIYSAVLCLPLYFGLIYIKK